MSYIKQITVDTNWLDAVDGMSVAAAIEYLHTLNPEHTLSYGLEGDTHGCNVTACLTYDVPMTNQEILAQLEVKYSNEIKIYEAAKLKHISRDNLEGIDRCTKMIVKYESLLAEAREKYK